MFVSKVLQMHLPKILDLRGNVYQNTIHLLLHWAKNFCVRNVCIKLEVCSWQAFPASCIIENLFRRFLKLISLQVLFSGVVQSGSIVVEHLTHNLKMKGSNHRPGPIRNKATDKKFSFFCCFDSFSLKCRFCRILKFCRFIIF